MAGLSVGVTVGLCFGYYFGLLRAKNIFREAYEKVCAMQDDGGID